MTAMERLGTTLTTLGLKAVQARLDGVLEEAEKIAPS